MLTFSDLCVESSTVWIEVGGWGRRRQETTNCRAQLGLYLNKSLKIAHAPARPTGPSPWEHLVWTKAPNWLIVGERSVFIRAQEVHSSRSDGLRFDSLLSISAPESPCVYVCQRGIFPCMSNTAVYCCPRWSMLLATFFVFFFTCTVHKIKYTSNTCAVWLVHCAATDQGVKGR